MPIPTIFQGDCLEVMRLLPDSSISAIVTDPPYGLGFMGKEWDDLPPGLPWAQECLRVLKPGGHLLAFGGTRTWHRLACAIEDAGFEMRDSIAWLYGSGFPKSLDVSKAIDKGNGRVGDAMIILKRKLREVFEESGLKRSEIDERCGFRASNYLTIPAEGKRPDPWVNVLPTAAKWLIMRDVLGCGAVLDGLFDAAEREVVGRHVRTGKEAGTYGAMAGDSDITAPATEAAQRWQGWGTALKPAFEPVVVARKPLVGTVAQNVLAYGTGAINVDAGRIESDGGHKRPFQPTNNGRDVYGAQTGFQPTNAEGRWPANVALDSDSAAELDQQSGTLTSGANPKRRGADGDRTAYGDFAGQEDADPKRGIDKGGASRFFYVAKAPKSERPVVDGVAHPTVKPLALMRWLVRMFTPPGGLVLDPFAGSGTTGEACMLEGFESVLIEKGAEYHPLIQARIARQQAKAETPEDAS